DTFTKNSTASSTVMFSTSDIDLPLNRISSVSRLYLLPLHLSHSTYTSGRKFISMVRIPPPWHSSHLRLFTLKENLPGVYPLILASGTCANSCLTSLKKPQ